MAAEAEQAVAQPQHAQEEEEPELAHQVDEEEAEQEGDVKLLITEFDSDEEPAEDGPREVEEEEDEESDIPDALGTSPPECCCVTPLAAINQAFQELG